MRFLILASLVLCVPLLGMAQQQTRNGASKLFTYPYTIDDLPNGLRLVTVPTDYPNLVSLYVVVSAGSRNEVEAGKSGFAHFFEHMMFRGSENYPSERREEGLDASVEALARPLRERGVDVAVDLDVESTLPSPTAELVYRAVQESLRNVARHAAATTARVALRDDGAAVTLVVEDDGRGMTGDNLREQHAAGHMGLALLADGVAARGGSLSIESEPGTGTRVHVSLPRE